MCRGWCERGLGVSREERVQREATGRSPEGEQGPGAAATEAAGLGAGSEEGSPCRAQFWRRHTRPRPARPPGLVWGLRPPGCLRGGVGRGSTSSKRGERGAQRQHRRPLRLQGALRTRGQVTGKTAASLGLGTRSFPGATAKGCPVRLGERHALWTGACRGKPEKVLENMCCFDVNCRQTCRL